MVAVVPLSYLIILMNIHPIASVTAGTQMALTALYPFATLEDALFGRLFLVFVAVMFVMMVVFVFMRTRRSTAIRTKIEELERIDTRLAAHIHEGLERGHVSLWRTVQLLYYVHMNAGLLDELARELDNSLAAYTLRGEQKKARRISEADRRLKDEVERVLQVNYQFAMDAEHAVMLLDPRRIPEQAIAEGGTGGEPLEVCSKADLISMAHIGDEEAVTVSLADLDLPDPDSTARIKHIDATAERLDEKIHQLEELHVIEEIPEQDVFGLTDEFSVIVSPDQKGEGSFHEKE